MLKKTILTALLTAPLLGSSLHSAQAATSFNDISNSYAKDAINKLLEAGILSGNGNGQFNPSGNITRQDFAIILVKGLGLDIEAVPASPTFSDLPPSHYAYKYVEAAVKAGLFKGTGSKQFGLGQNLSRQDMAVIFTRALGVDPQGYGKDLKFSDASKIADYAKDAVGFAVQFGLLTGTSNGTFNPSGMADRQSVALVTSRFLTVKEDLPASVVPQPVNPQPTTPQPKPSTPTVPTPTTPSNPPVNNGGGSTPAPIVDVQAPVLTLVSVAPFEIGTDLIVRSNEVGTVYLVPLNTKITSKAALDALVTGGKGVKATVTAANANTVLATSTLAADTYKAYAVDASGNVSEPVMNLTLEVPFTAPTLDALNPQTIRASFPAALNTDSRPDLEDFVLTRTDNGHQDPITISDLRIEQNDVMFYLDGDAPIEKGAAYTLTYTKHPKSSPIQNVAGKEYDSFTNTFTYNNHAPNRGFPINEKTMDTHRDSSAISLVPLFYDMDDDDVLTYTVSSDKPEVVSVTLSQDGQSLLLHSKGTLDTATIKVTADDGHGGKTSTMFPVTVLGITDALAAIEATFADAQIDLTDVNQSKALQDRLFEVGGTIMRWPEEEAAPYQSRVQALFDKLSGLNTAKGLVDAMEQTTGSSKNLMAGSIDRQQADEADANEQASSYRQVLTGITLQKLEQRAAAARLVLQKTDEVVNQIRTVTNSVTDDTDLTTGSEDRNEIEANLPGDLYELGLNPPTVQAIQWNETLIYQKLRDVAIVLADVQLLESAVASAEGKPSNDQEWSNARILLTRINYSKLNTATKQTLETRANAAASKIPAVPEP